MADEVQAAAGEQEFAREQLRWNGWGRRGQGFDLQGRDEALWSYLAEALGIDALPETPAVRLEDVALDDGALDDEARRSLHEALAGQGEVRTDRLERLFHAVGRSYHDMIRIRSGQVSRAPDAVAYPESPEAVTAALAWAQQRGWAVVPFGGGSSVVGGVEPPTDERWPGVLTLDISRLNRLLELDESSHTARFEAGVYGPQLERALQQRGYTLGHYPQSWEFSTLGGWIAARGAGQQSNRYGTSDKFLVAATVQTPRGPWQIGGFPASAAGPNLGQLVAGSEGTLGVIVDATIKIHEVPESSDYRGYLFKDFRSGAEAIRQIVQAEIPVAMMRLSDGDETRFFSKFKSVGHDGQEGGVGSSTALRTAIKKVMEWTGYGEHPCVMLIGLEGEAEQVRVSQARTLAVCLRQGALPLGAGPGRSWYEGRFQMPYLRDPLMDRGVGVDTLETSTTWSNLHHLHRAVREAIADAIEARGGRGLVLSHISHSYEVGASLYFTFVFPRDLDDELGQWRAIKRAASDVIAREGGTISHHHGVGADHLDWMEAEKGPLGLAVLRGAKEAVDPGGIMNPGKLLPPQG